MNLNLTEISKATQWKPGQSVPPCGNPNQIIVRVLATIPASEGSRSPKASQLKNLVSARSRIASTSPDGAGKSVQQLAGVDVERAMSGVRRIAAPSVGDFCFKPPLMI